MVDVGAKAVTARVAEAEGAIRMSPEAFEVVENESGPKGDVIGTAEIAGLMAAKKTAELIPLCHQLALSNVKVKARLDHDLPGVRVSATASATERTGVEMEALTAVSVALLTVYDMVKALGHGMEIGEIKLLKKSGGSKGDWNA